MSDEPDQSGAPEPIPPNRPSGRSLTFRILAMLTLALLPLGLIAVFQSSQALQAARQTYRDNLNAQTVRAASPEGDAIKSAFGLASGLAAALPPIVADNGACEAVMQRTVSANPRLTFAGFIDNRQITSCNSLGREFDFSDSPGSDRVFASGVRDVTFNSGGAASERAVVIVSEPVTDADGALLGFVSLSLPSRSLEEARETAGVADAVRLLTFNRQGDILTSDLPRDEVEAILPANVELAELVGTDQRVFSGRGRDGRARDFALVPIVGGKAYALGSWETARPLAQEGVIAVGPLVFPLLMWLASLLVAVVSLRSLVIVPIRTLRMRMRSFADGRAVFRANAIGSAPRELREIGSTFELLANQIVRDEAELQDKVHEREVLLREVHHRVKNNLQLMSSIINMQIRQNASEEVEEALRRIQGRLASLAKFHQDLYETSSISRLRADQLLEDLTRQMLSMTAGPERRIDLRLNLDEVTLSPEQASPLAMLVTEALTNALKYAEADPGERLFVAVSMKRDLRAEGEFVDVAIENSLAGTTDGSQMPEGLGSRLITAFASQLEATLERGFEDGRYALRLRFERQAYAPDAQGTVQP